MSATSTNIPFTRSSKKLFISRKKLHALRKESHYTEQRPAPKDDTYLKNQNTLKTQTETDSETGSDTVVSSHDGSTTDASFISSCASSWRDESSVLDLAWYDCSGGNIKVSNKCWSRNLSPNITTKNDDHDEQESFQDDNSVKYPPSVSSSSHEEQSFGGSKNDNKQRSLQSQENNSTCLSVHSRTSSEASIAGRFDASISSHTDVTTDSEKSPKGHHSAYKDDSSCISGHDQKSIVLQDDKYFAMTTGGMPNCICLSSENDKYPFEEDAVSNYSGYCSTSAAAQGTGRWACVTCENDDQTLHQTLTFDENNRSYHSEGEGNQISTITYDDQIIAGNATYGFCFTRGDADQVVNDAHTIERDAESYHSKDYQSTVVDVEFDDDIGSHQSEVKSCNRSILSDEDKPAADDLGYGCFACRNDDDVFDETQTFCSRYSEYNGYQSSIISSNEQSTIVNAPCCVCLPSRNTDQVLNDGETNDKDVASCHSQQSEKEKILIETSNCLSKHVDSTMTREPTGFIRFSFRGADDAAKLVEQNNGEATSSNTAVWGDHKVSIADEDVRPCQSFACCHHDDQTLDDSSSLISDVRSCRYGVKHNALPTKDKTIPATEIRQVSKDLHRKWDKSTIDAKLEHIQLQYSMEKFLKDIESDLDEKQNLKTKHRQLRNSRKTCLMDIEHDQDDTNVKNVDTIEHSRVRRPQNVIESDVANVDKAICCTFVCSKNDRVSDELYAESSKNKLFKNKNEDLILANRIQYSDSSSVSSQLNDENTPFDERAQRFRSKMGGKNFKTKSEHTGYPFDELKKNSLSPKQETPKLPLPSNLIKEETTKYPSSFLSMFNIFSNHVVDKGSDITVDTNENLPESVEDYLDDYSAAMHDLVFGGSTGHWWWCCSGTNTTDNATTAPAQQTPRHDEIDPLLDTTVETNNKGVASATRETGKRKKKKKKKKKLQGLLF